ncbi:MAG: hypothetical protein U0973_10015, partial [Xanthomonadaceae bacterium]|nr:hypothetical protein [Xanthomonadaceae bacterium]
MSSLNITAMTRPDDVVRIKQSALALAVLLACVSWGADAATFPLGSAGSFGALASQTVTCTGAGAITGDVGVSPGSAVVGFPPCSLTGTLHVTDGAAGSGIADAGTAFTALAGLAADAD